MPKFLIDKLKKEYPGNDSAVYGTLNNIGAMHGNKETAKGRAMEAKHNAKIQPMADGGVAGALPYQTKLNPQQEAEFQNYVKLRPGYAFDPLPQSDYDERGQWLAQKQGLDPGGNWAAPGSSLLEQKSDGPHGSDVWKTPYHRTFSNESKYAMTGREPRWTQDGLLQTPTGATVADESDEGKKSALRGLKGVKKMFTGGVVRRPDYNRPYDPNDPEQEYPGMPPSPMPQMPTESMDPTAGPAPPPMPTELSRFNTQPDDEAGSGPPPAPSPAEQAPPPSPDAIGRDPRYRNLAIQQKETQDQAPPPMPGLRNQGTAQQQAIDYAQKILMDPKHPGQFKQPSVLQNVLGAIAPRFNMHPNLTRQYQNYELLKSRADEERKMQQAQSQEEIKKDTLETNAAYRARMLDSKTAPPQRLTGDAQKVSLLEEGYAKQPGITPAVARELALRDYKAQYTKPSDVWRKGDIIPDATSITGYSRKMYNSRTGTWETEKDIIPGIGFFGTTTETTKEIAATQANNDVVATPMSTSVTRRPNIPGRNPLGVPPMTPAPVEGQAPATPPSATPRVIGHRNPAPPAAIRPQTYAVPDGKGGFKLQAFGPGDTIPEGTVSAAGVNKAGTNAAESGELTPAGATQMKEVDVVAQQFDALLRKLEPYKTDNNPLTLSVPMAKYKIGMKSPEGELGNEISNLSLSSIQGMMPFASKSRNYQFIKDIGQHLPHLNVVGGDSPALIYDKLQKARANFEGMRKSISRYEVKHAKVDQTPAATGVPATAEDYLKSIGHQ